MGSSVNENQLLSKIALSDGHGENSPYFDGWKAYDSNPFHPIHNPEGVIQMGLSENQLCFDIIEDWIKKNPKASICTAEGISKFREVANFQDYHGLPEFRKAVAKFMELVRGEKVKFDPERIVMSGGATGASETLMFCLADPGDAFLVPSPYYPAFARDLRWRTGLQLIPVSCSSSNNFQISISDLEAAYDEAQAANINVKGLIITNPSNPLGTTLERDVLKRLLDFICRKNIHLVCDEIYSATVFSYPKFVSIAEVMEETECNRDLIHIIYSLSKDMGFPGLRVGIIYSYNDVVVTCARRMSSFGLVSSQSQYLLASMLSDEAFIKRFLEESAKRLGRRHDIFVKGLEDVGISCLNSNAGLYFWMDLRHLLEEQSFDAEMKLWRVIINDVKLNVSPGSSFQCVEPGFFRVCFANMDDHTVVVALRRIQEFAARGKKEDQEGKANKRIWKRNLAISLSSGNYDETILSSPHSPIRQSPLVRART